MNAAALARQITSIIAILDTRLRRGLISPEEHLITVAELERWAARRIWFEAYNALISSTGRATQQPPED